MLKYHNNYILAVVSLYPVTKTYSSGSTIMFTGIRSSNGLNSTSLADIRNKGYFTCDKSGLYWISISITTHTPASRVDMYKNGGLLEYMYQQHVTNENLMTFASLEHLSKGDTIMIKAATSLYIHGSRYSVLSVFQITT